MYKYSYTDRNGATIRSNCFGDVAMFRSIALEQEARTREWVESLHQMGCTVAHPDDGWVDRKGSYVGLCYPYYEDGVSVGDKMALGWPDKYRIVEVVGIKNLGYIKRVYFRDCSSADAAIKPWWEQLVLWIMNLWKGGKD